MSRPTCCAPRTARWARDPCPCAALRAALPAGSSRVSVPVLLALTATVVVGLLSWVVPLPDPGATTSPPPRARPVRVALVGALPLALGVAAVLAEVVEHSDDLAPLGTVLAVAAAVVGGGPATSAVLRLVPAPTGQTTPAASVLRGGATIGVLERAAICVAAMLGSAEGIAVVLAVKSLGRYPELREPGTSERFIIGTFTSVLWALACAGVAVLARS